MIISIDTKDADVQLVAPDIPGIPSKTLHYFISKMVESALPIINDVLYNHSFVLPSNWTAFFVNAQVRVVWQRGTQGYFEISSYCNTDPKDHSTHRCTYVPENTSGVVSSESTTSMSSTDNTFNSLNTGVKENTTSLSTSTIFLRIVASNSCELDIGEQMNGYAFEDTRGFCNPWYFPGMFYSLNLTLNGSSIVELKYFCNTSDCESCGNNVNGIVEMDKCSFDMESGLSSIFSMSFCFGPPVYKTNLADNYYFAFLPANCTTNQYFALQNMGTLNHCFQTDGNSFFGVFFQGNGSYLINLNCQDACTNCSSLVISNPGLCTLFDDDQQQGTLFRFSDISECSVEQPSVLIPTPNPTPTHWLLIPKIFIPLVVVVIHLVILLIFCVKRKWYIFCVKHKWYSSLKASISNIRRSFQAQFIALVNAIRQYWLNFSFKKNINELLKSNEAVAIPLLITTVIQSCLWPALDPFQDFTSITIKKTGLPADMIDYSGLDSFFPKWSAAAQIVYIAFSAITSFSLFIRILMGHRKVVIINWM